MDQQGRKAIHEDQIIIGLLARGPRIWLSVWSWFSSLRRLPPNTPLVVLSTNHTRVIVPDYEDAGYGCRNQPFAMFVAGYGNELFSVQANTASVDRSASKARIAGFRGGSPYSPILENFGLLTLVLMSAYGY